MGAPCRLSLVGRLFLASIFVFLIVASAVGKLRGDEVLVLKDGDVVYIRSVFSAKEDVLIKVGKGDNRQINYLSGALIPVDTKMSPPELERAQWIFHKCDDDVAPWKVNGTYIGANHGASDVVKIMAPDHGLSVEALGSVWKDEAGVSFNLIELDGSDALLFLSDNMAAYPGWSFSRHIVGASLTNEKNGTVLKVENSSLTQLWPACRIKEQLYLADGVTPLRDGVPTTCRFLDISEDYDIVAPDAVLQSVKSSPGQSVSFVAEGLEAILSNQIRYRYLPQGACVIRHKAKALRPLTLEYMGFIQSAFLSADSYDVLEYYIPKTSPFSQDDIAYDFQGVQRFSKPTSPLFFSVDKGNIPDSREMPDRFIQFLGRQDGERVARRVGFAMGYSLLDGLTVPASRTSNTGNPLFVHTSAKIYPAAIDAKFKPIAAGDEFLCVAYRQYFDPAAFPGATDVYGHLEGNDYVLYADFHQPTARFVLPIPMQYVCAKYAVVEKSPSVILEQAGVISATGTAISVQGDYGRLVLRIFGGQ